MSMCAEIDRFFCQDVNESREETAKTRGLDVDVFVSEKVSGHHRANDASSGMHVLRFRFNLVVSVRINY